MRRRGFTLVELLVVVGITAVLIALLMPALAKVRKHAQEVHCAANLHSIGHALAMYTQQSGYYPGSVYVVAPNIVVIWQPRLRHFLGGERGVFHCPARSPENEWPTEPEVPTFTSVGWSGRATAEHTNYGYELGEALLVPGLPRFSYGYNAHGTDSMGGYPVQRQRGLGSSIRPDAEVISAGGRLTELRASRVKVPAEMIAIADMQDVRNTHCGLSGWISYVDDPLPPRPAAIHRGGANVLFCDGHVQWYLPGELVYVRDPGLAPIAFQNRRLWNNDHEP